MMFDYKVVELSTDGQLHDVTFSGPDAKQRSVDYCEWRRSQGHDVTYADEDAFDRRLAACAEKA